MKRRWKKFLAGVLSAALALNLAAPLALAGSSTIGAACRVTSVFLYPEYVGRVDDNERVPYIQGTVSYNRGLLTFDGDVTLDTTSDPYNSSLVEALSEKNLRLVANGKVTGRTKGNGIEKAKEIAGGEYDLTYADLGKYSVTKPIGILGGDTGTTITAGTEITLKDFHTGIGGGNVQIDGTVNITGAQFQGATYGIANFTTMNHGSELLIHAQQYIGEQGHLTYNGGHLLLNVTTIGMDFGLSRLGIGENVSRFWYRTDDDAGYTEIDTSVQEKLDSFFEVKETNHAYLELTDVDPDQQESETYALLVAGTQVTKSNQNDVLEDGGSVKFDPTTNTLTLNDADLTLDGAAGGYCCIDSQLAEELTITGTATLSNADGILTEGPLTLNNADLTITGNIDGDIGEDAIRAGRSDEDITIENSTVTIAGTNSEGNFFHYGIRCGKLTVANSTLDVKAGGSAIVAADEMEVSGAGTVITAETDASEEQDYYALELGRLIMSHGLDLVEGKMNESKKAKIAQPEQAPTDFKVYWVVRPGDEPVNGGMQFPGAITGSEEEARLFEGWFLEDGTRLEDSPYYMGPGANHVGNLDRDVTFYGHWRTAESGEGSPDGGDGFGTLLAGVAVVGAAGVVAYQVGTELILDQLLPAGVAVPHTRAELAMLLWNTAGRPAPATLPAFADVADPELAQAAQWAIEQGYLKARADGSFKPDKGVAKWRVIRGYRAVTEP